MAINPDAEDSEQTGGADKYADWYERTDELWQGTLLRGTRVFEESGKFEEGKPPRVVSRRADAIILTQSCDIDKRAQNRLLVAEIQSYRRLAEELGKPVSEKGYRKDLIAGRTIAEFLLPPAQDVLDDWSVVNFRELYTIDRDRTAAADAFVGLASPYREHLGQAFARFMMRVTLPSNLSEFEHYSV
ncbi:hypothetical protein [Mycobacterium paraffinicum]|uniref:Uncharacterized protein n=1 Tax=Mycobacterium paraffinicum TaxID=53378 RepID=A0ABP8F672_9MYCO|nr:hypothetical protein [Mycobacterium paraffinicum]MCV7311271.1 hypothetical protein [Mycobacterium paraffinicum]